MSHLKLNSLLFYGVAIGSVLLLFNVVTAYGEANIKAPVAVDGRYRLSFDQNLPNCLNSVPLALDIQQSGIYLNGFLLPASANAETARAGEKKPSLNGRLSNQKLSLTGLVPSSIFCVPPSAASDTSLRNTLRDRPTNNALSKVEINSNVEKEKLAGKMTLSNIPGTIEFTGQKEAPVPSSEKSSSH